MKDGCRIGKNTCITGCEWKRIFGYDCSNTKEVDNEIAKTKRVELKFVKLDQKQATKTKNIKEENKLIEKIGIAVQDDWISKIKTL